MSVNSTICLLLTYKSRSNLWLNRLGKFMALEASNAMQHDYYERCAVMLWGYTNNSHDQLVMQHICQGGCVHYCVTGNPALDIFGIVWAYIY